MSTMETDWVKLKFSIMFNSQPIKILYWTNI